MYCASRIAVSAGGRVGEIARHFVDLGMRLVEKAGIGAGQQHGDGEKHGSNRGLAALGAHAPQVDEPDEGKKQGKRRKPAGGEIERQEMYLQHRAEARRNP
jgi:hypothetical protein